MLGFFFGLEEDKITWHSNSRAWLVTYAGLEEDEITWFSNRNGSSVLRYKYKEIAGHSNSRDSVRRTTSGLEEDKLHGTQTYLVWQIKSAHFEEE